MRNIYQSTIPRQSFLVLSRHTEIRKITEWIIPAPHFLWQLMTGIRKITDIEKHFSDEPNCCRNQKYCWVKNHWREIFSNDWTITELRNFTESTITEEKLLVTSGLIQNKEILLSRQLLGKKTFLTSRLLQKSETLLSHLSREKTFQW